MQTEEKSHCETVLPARVNPLTLPWSRRVTRTAASHGIKTTTVYTEPDALSEHAHASPYSINIGPANAYLDGEKIIRIAKSEGCDAVHPGYGFVGCHTPTP